MPVKIFKRPDSQVWHYRGTAAGRRLRGSTGTADKELAKRIASEAENRAWKRHLDGPGASVTMAQAALAYRSAGKSARFLEPIEDHWQDTPIREITAGAIRASAIQLYPNAGPATRNRQVIVPTQAIINHAAELDWCAPIKVRRFRIDTKPKKPATREWVDAFTDSSSPHLGALCLFMFGTGARIGEAVALTWADVDLEARTATIQKTKMGDGRIAHLQQPLVVAIANIPSNRNPHEPVFRYLARENVRKAWDGTIKRAGIEKLPPHSCRHGFATAMLRAGVDVKTVAERGGWKDVRTLLETYAHAIADPTVTDAIFGTDLTRYDPAQPVSDGKIKGNSE